MNIWYHWREYISAVIRDIGPNLGIVPWGAVNSDIILLTNSTILPM